MLGDFKTGSTVLLPICLKERRTIGTVMSARLMKDSELQTKTKHNSRLAELICFVSVFFTPPLHSDWLEGSREYREGFRVKQMFLEDKDGIELLLT